MKKIMMMAVIMMASVLFIPSVFAADEWEVNDITVTAGDSLIGTEGGKITTSGNKTTITYDGKNFKALVGTGACANAESVSNTECQGETTDRPYGYAWIGFTIKTTLENGDLKVKVPGANEFSTTGVSGKTYTDYVGINVDKLKTALEKGEKVVYTYDFEIDSNGSKKTHTVEIIINPETTVLYKVGSDGNDPQEIEYDGPEEKRILDEKKAKQSIAEEKPAENKESNPDTADINLLSLLALIIASGFGITYSVKKVRKN